MRRCIKICTHTDGYIQSSWLSLCSNVWQSFCFLIKALVFSLIRHPIKWRVSTLLRFSSCTQHKQWRNLDVATYGVGWKEEDRWMVDTGGIDKKKMKGVENERMIRRSIKRMQEVLTRWCKIGTHCWKLDWICDSLTNYIVWHKLDNVYNLGTKANFIAS